VAPGGSLNGDLTSFGTDAQGEIYILDRDGLVLKLMPPFPDLAVSAPGAVDFRLERDGDWTWEDLELSSMHPVDNYRVYRGTPDGPFTCLFESPDPVWAAGGDSMVPAPRELLAYIVTAVSAGEETSSGSPPRDLGGLCP
jgi:hypothetical protein